MMTPSQIRCLLAVLALSEAYEHIESKDVAHLLGIKATVHNALGVLQGKGLIEKERYGSVNLTDEGLSLARKLETRRDDLTLLFSGKLGLSPEEGARAAITLMGELSQESIISLQQHRRNEE